MDLEATDRKSQGSDAEAGIEDDEDREVNLAGNRLDDKKKKEKKRRPVKTLKLEDFTNRETGMKALYDTFKKSEAKLTKKAQTQPEKALEDYLSLVKEWAFNVAPKYEFTYFMDRCQTYGHKREVTDELNKLRKYHKGELAYDAATKEYVEATSQNRRVLITAEEPRPAKMYQDEQKRTVKVQDYDPTADPDRALESFPDKDGLEYAIKKKVKVNEENTSSPSVKGSRMDVEND